ncbi:MAG: ATP synthase F1 subunit delta [Leptospirillia bacterium]
MSDAVIAKRYAAALFELVTDAAERDRVRGELGTLGEVMGHEALKSALGNPRIHVAEKQAVVASVAEKVGASERPANLARLLVLNDRMDLFGEVADAFSHMVDEAEGRLVVTVTSAFSLPKDLKSRVDARLTEILGGKAEIRHAEDADILGGLVIRIGSRVFDHSVRYQLARLRQAL